MELRLLGALPVVAVLGWSAAGCARDEEPSRALTDAEYVASCIGIGGAEFEPPAVLCVGSLDGSTRELGHQMTAGVGPSLSADRSRIAFADDGRLVVVDARGEEVDVIDGQRGLTSVEWLPDGSGFIVQRELASGGFDLAEIRSGQDTPVVLVPADEMPGDVEKGFAVSPDGAHIAYTTQIGGAWELRVVDLGSGDQRALYSSEEWIYWPSWSPNGDRIAVVLGRSISSIDVRDGTVDLEALTGRDVTTPTWSPDGTALLFVDSRGVLLRVTAGDISTMRAIVDYTSGDSGRRFPALPGWS